MKKLYFYCSIIIFCIFAELETWIMKNNYLLSFYRFIVALVLLLTTQAIFYALNDSLFNVSTFSDWAKLSLGSFRFALASTSIFLSPFIFLALLPIKAQEKKWYKTITSILFFFGVELMLIANLIDCGYYRFTFKRLTFDFFGYVGVGGDFGTLIPQFLRDYFHIVAIFLLLNIVLIVFDIQIRLYIKRRSFNNSTKPINNTSQNFLRKFAPLIISVIMLFIFFRGGLQKTRLNLEDAGSYASTQNTGLVLNTPFCLIRTIGVDGVDEKTYFSNSKVEKIFSPIQEPSNEIWTDSLLSSPLQIGKTNVVIIIIESYSAEYTGVYNKNKSYTPFLDSLAKHSVVFQGMSNGRRSIDGIPCVLSSLPLLMEESYITSKYKTNKLGSIASLLKNNGYSSAFFHGGYNGTMDFDKYAKNVGFDKYYGMNEYGNKNDYDGNWGIFDEPFLQYMVKKVSLMKEPFVASVFTLSSHHPYTIPKEHIGQFPKGTLKIHEPVGYTDYALRRFFNTAKQQSWFNNTLFVITADHSSINESHDFRTPLGLYRIPIIFYSPQFSHGVVNNQIMQQADILPTINDMLHNNKKVFAYGRSIFSKKTHYYIYFSNGEYILTIGKFISKYREGYPTQLFDKIKDEQLKNDISNKYPNITQQYTRFTQAIIQQYNNRLIKNQMTNER